MKAFDFPLERVLHWRRTQFELERAAMERLVRQRSEVDASLLELAANRGDAERAIAHAGGLDSCDLQTLSAFQTRNTRQQAALGDRQRILDRELETQRAKNVEAQRRVKLLERLRGKRLDRWTSEMNAEQETFAAEAWLGRWPGAAA